MELLNIDSWLAFQPLDVAAFGTGRWNAGTLQAILQTIVIRWGLL